MKSVNLFKALVDETRLRLVNLSLHHELNVNEIVAILGMGQSRISRHLKILSDNQLLKHRRDGLWTFYSAAMEGYGSIFIEAIKYLFQQDPVFKEDLARTEKVLEERSREMVHFFNSIAQDWEKLKREIIGNLDLNALILKYITATRTIVDLGCGTGDLIAAMKEKAKRVIGVEKSPKMLAEARRRFADDDENVELRIGELEHLPLREGEADLAVTNMVLHHLPNPLTALQEVHRVLKKGDVFIIVDLVNHELEGMRQYFGDHWLGFSEEDIKKWLETSGFAPQKIEYFDLKKGLKGFIVQSVKESNEMK